MEIISNELRSIGAGMYISFVVVANIIAMAIVWEFLDRHLKHFRYLAYLQILIPIIWGAAGLLLVRYA